MREKEKEKGRERERDREREREGREKVSTHLFRDEGLPKKFGLRKAKERSPSNHHTRLFQDFI